MEEDPQPGGLAGRVGLEAAGRLLEALLSPQTLPPCVARGLLGGRDTRSTGSAGPGRAQRGRGGLG